MVNFQFTIWSFFPSSSFAKSAHKLQILIKLKNLKYIKFPLFGCPKVRKWLTHRGGLYAGFYSIPFHLKHFLSISQSYFSYGGKSIKNYLRISCELFCLEHSCYNDTENKGLYYDKIKIEKLWIEQRFIKQLYSINHEKIYFDREHITCKTNLVQSLLQASNFQH